MVKIADLDNELFKIVHLSAEWQNKCDKFETNPEGKGLEIYIRHYALNEELANLSRTYLIIDIASEEIVAYFTLRTGLITVSRGFLKGFDTMTGIELANFAVNEKYKHLNYGLPKLGMYVYDTFIIPLVQTISELVGAKFLYIFALPKDKLINHYEKMGFLKGDRQMSKYVYSHVKPVYDRGCVFMYQPIG